MLYLTPNARFDFLLNLPEAKDIGSKVNEAMRDGRYKSGDIESTAPGIPRQKLESRIVVPSGWRKRWR